MAADLPGKMPDRAPTAPAEPQPDRNFRGSRQRRRASVRNRPADTRALAGCTWPTAARLRRRAASPSLSSGDANREVFESVLHAFTDSCAARAHQIGSADRPLLLPVALVQQQFEWQVAMIRFDGRNLQRGQMRPIRPVRGMVAHIHGFLVDLHTNHCEISFREHAFDITLDQTGLPDGEAAEHRDFLLQHRWFPVTEPARMLAFTPLAARTCSRRRAQCGWRPDAPDRVRSCGAAGRYVVRWRGGPANATSIRCAF